MKFGIIGSGMIARFHAQAIKDMQGGELVGIYGKRAESVQPLADEFQVDAFTDLDEFLQQPDLEIVTIATPSGAHLDPSLAAMTAGKHVVCEKPLEVTTARLDEMVKAAEENEVTLSAILNRRFHPGMDAFKQAADEGRFGKLTSASAYIKWYRDQAYYDQGAWRGTWALDGGGALMNQGIHTIDALLYLAGPVKSVQARTKCVAHKDIEVEDLAVAMLEFENGALGVIEGSTATWSEDGHPARVQLAGTEGSVFLADEAFEVWDFKTPRAGDDQVRETLMTGSSKGLGANDPKAINTYQHQRNFEEVVSAIKEGREPKTNAAEARRSVALIEAIYESARNDGAKVLL